MQRFRGFKGFLFLMVFLPVLVMGEVCTSYTDIDGSQYKSEILDASDLGWITCRDTFRPYDKVNRIEALKSVLEADNRNIPNNNIQCFDDVDSNDWSSPYVCYAKDNGLVNGKDCNVAEGSNEPAVFGYCSADPMLFSEISKVILETLTNDDYIPDSGDAWYSKYLAKMKLYGFDYQPTDTINRDLFVHMVTQVKKDPNKQAETLEITSVNIAPNALLIGDEMQVEIGISEPLGSQYSIKIDYETSSGSREDIASCSSVSCSKSITTDKLGENLQLSVSLYKESTKLQTITRSYSVSEELVDDNSTAPLVSSVSPTTAQLNTETTFTVTGKNLPSTLAMYIEGCENMTSLGGDSTQMQFSCSPNNTNLENKDALVKDEAGGVTLYSFSVGIIDSRAEYMLKTVVSNVGGAPGQVSSTPKGIVNCREGDQGMCQAPFKDETIIITAYPEDDSLVEFGEGSCTKIEENDCTVAMDSDRVIDISFKPKDDTITLTLDSAPQSLKIKPNEPLNIDFRVTKNRDDTVHVLQVDLNDGSTQDVINCAENFSMKDIVTCEVSYSSTGKYTLTATAYSDTEMSIKSNMVSLPLEVSTATDDTKYTGHQNQEHLKKFWTNNPTTAKEKFLVDTATGTQNLSLSFLAQKGQVDLALGISYNSGLAKDASKGALGAGWSHSYGVRSRIEKFNDSILILHTSDNRENGFKKDSNGVYISMNRPQGVLANYYDKITKNSDGYILEHSNKTKKYFDNDGKLLYIVGKNSDIIQFNYDGNKLKSVTEEISGITLNYEYNDDDSIKTVSDKIGRTVYFTYEEKRLKSILDVDGTVHLFGYNDNAEMQTYQIQNDDNDFFYFTNTYDDLGRVTTQKDAKGNTTLFDYDESSFGIIQTAVTTPLNNRRVYTYNSNYQLLKFVDEIGGTTTNKYTSSGLLRSTTNPKGLTTTYSYNDEGFKSKVESPNNSTVWYYYDENANLVESTDELGYMTKYTYDSDNRPLEVIRDVEGDVKVLSSTKYYTEVYTYSNNLKTNMVYKIETTTAKGNKTTQTFKKGLLDTSTTPENVKTSYIYDDIGELKEQRLHADGGEYITKFEYNDLGQVIKATDPEGKTVSKTYSIFGSVATITDAKGNRVSHEYDDNGNLIKTVAPENTITTYNYNGDNQPTVITDANGNTDKITYDVKGRKRAIFNSQDQQLAQYRYDALDTLIETYLYDDSGSKIPASTTEYDIPTRYTKTISHLGKLERAIEQHLDSKGRVFRSLNPAREAKEFEYENHFDTITSVTAYGTTTYQTVDDEANLETLTDLANNTNKFAHDSQKDKTLEESALGKTHRTTYNSQYLVETFTNARGQTRNFTYYKNGWLKTATSDGAVWTFVYDDNGNLLTMSSDEGTITRAYDVFNRVISYTDQNGNTLGYKYDNVGNLTELTYPDGKKVTYTYDSSNRLETVTDWNGVTLVTYSYTRQGKLLKELRDNGSSRSYTYYNGIGELESIKDTKADGSTIVPYAYEYDLKGNIVQETKEDGSNSSTFNYTYNDQGILQKVTIDPREEIYDISNLSIVSAKDNRAETINTQTIGYDDDGNMVNYMLDGTDTTLEYDEKSRLTKVGDIEHIYSIEDAKIETIVDSKSTKFVVDTNRKLSQLLVEESSTGKKTYHIYGVGLVASIDDEGTHYYHYDYRGSTTALTNSDGDITDRYTYLPYGKMINHRGFSKTRFLYVGKYGIEKEASGLYYMRARYYDADIKRFISKDSLVGSVSDGLSLNRYLYANGNPINNIDKNGNDWFKDLGDGLWDAYDASVEGITTAAIYTGERIKDVDSIMKSNKYTGSFSIFSEKILSNGIISPGLKLGYDASDGIDKISEADGFWGTTGAIFENGGKTLENFGSSALGGLANPMLYSEAFSSTSHQVEYTYNKTITKSELEYRECLNKKLYTVLNVAISFKDFKKSSERFGNKQRTLNKNPNLNTRYKYFLNSTKKEATYDAGEELIGVYDSLQNVNFDPCN